MVIWSALFSVVFIGLLVSIGCAILFALLKPPLRGIAVINPLA